MKTTIVIILVILLGVFGFWLWRGGTVELGPVGDDYKDISYEIEGKIVKLSGEVKYFGNDAVADLNGDGREDRAFLITQEPGGSGTFYYAVVTLGGVTRSIGTNGILLGDRIAPQNINISGQTVEVNYADRRIGEPMTTAPSVGVTKYLKVEAGRLVDIGGNDKVRVSTPRAGSSVGSPLEVSGSAVGNWYFEASFPVRMLDANGRQLGQVPAQALGDWMTTDFVPFRVLLTFDQPTTATGTLVFAKDNPSGLPEHDEQVTIPVRFH